MSESTTCPACQHPALDHTAALLAQPSGAPATRAGCVRAIGLSRCACVFTPQDIAGTTLDRARRIQPDELRAQQDAPTLAQDNAQPCAECGDTSGHLACADCGATFPDAIALADHVNAESGIEPPDDDAPPYCFCGHNERAHEPVVAGGIVECSGCAFDYTGDEDEPHPAHTFDAATDATGADLPRELDLNTPAWDAAERALTPEQDADDQTDGYDELTGAGGYCSGADADHWYDNGTCGYCAGDWVAGESQRDMDYAAALGTDALARAAAYLLRELDADSESVTAFRLAPLRNALRAALAPFTTPPSA